MTAQHSMNLEQPKGPYQEAFLKYLNTDLGNAAWKFDQNNPHVYSLFTRFAREVLGKGRGKFGIAAIWERMRWEMAFSTVDDKPFKISNNHKAYYARKIMSEFKAFEGFFNIKAARQ